MRDLHSTVSPPGFRERGAVESFSWPLIRLLEALDPPSPEADSLSVKGRAGSASRGPLGPRVWRALRATFPGLVRSPGAEVGASTARAARILSLLLHSARGIPIVWRSLPTKQRTLNVEGTAVKRQIDHSQPFPELSTV